MKGSTGHVLVVDDNRMNRLEVSRGVELHGHTVDVAETGRETSSMLREQWVDLVLLDIKMPEDAFLADAPKLVPELRAGFEHGDVTLLTRESGLTSLRIRQTRSAGPSNQAPNSRRMARPC